MKLSLEITIAAKQDIIEGVYYYQKISEELAERFYNEIFQSLEEIKKNPAYFTYYQKPFRRLVLKHFPYLIIFKIYGEVVIITGVVFAKQNPDTINQRSKI